MAGADCRAGCGRRHAESGGGCTRRSRRGRHGIPVEGSSPHASRRISTPWSTHFMLFGRTSVRSDAGSRGRTDLVLNNGRSPTADEVYHCIQCGRGGPERITGHRPGPNFLHPQAGCVPPVPELRVFVDPSQQLYTEGLCLAQPLTFIKLICWRARNTILSPAFTSPDTIHNRKATLSGSMRRKLRVPARLWAL